MVVERDALKDGVVLKGTYKKVERTVVVTGGEDGKFKFDLDDGTTYNSISGAARAVMGGHVNVNGWLFFWIDGTKPPRKTRATNSEMVDGVAVTRTRKRAAPKTKKLVQIKRRRNQDGAPDGEVAWFCSACMGSFFVANSVTPDECPQGHPRVVVDDLAMGTDDDTPKPDAVEDQAAEEDAVPA